jgi:hypothetical protein
VHRAQDVDGERAVRTRVDERVRAVVADVLGQVVGDLAARVQALWLDGKRDEAAALIPDEFVLKSNLLGTEAMVKERIRVYRDAGITTLRVQPEGDSAAERLRTLGRLMDLVREVNGEMPAVAASG